METIYGEGNTTDDSHYLIVYIDGGNLINGIVFDGSDWTYTLSTQSVNDDKWHHVAYVKRASNYYELYFDGVSVDINDTDVSIPNIDDVRIGCINAGGTDWFFNGTIDEVSIFNRDLTREEILDSIY